MRYEIRELGIGGILDQAITLVKNHFGLLLAIMLVLSVPAQIISGLIAIPFAQKMQVQLAGMQPNPQDPAEAFQPVIAFFAVMGPILLIGFLIVTPLTNAAITHALASEYLERTTSLKDAYGRAFHVLLQLIVTTFLTYLLIGLGSMCCYIPGIIFMFIFWLTTQIVVIEGTWGVAAMKRSRELMRGNYITAIVLVILLFIIQLALGFMNNLIPQPYIAIVLSTFIQTGVAIFFSAVWVVFYFSCRCKNEGFDLAMLADAVGRE